MDSAASCGCLQLPVYFECLNICHLSTQLLHCTMSLCKCSRLGWLVLLQLCQTSALTHRLLHCCGWYHVTTSHTLAAYRIDTGVLASQLHCLPPPPHHPAPSVSGPHRLHCCAHLCCHALHITPHQVELLHLTHLNQADCTHSCR